MKGIYKITNIKTGNFYIGQSKDIDKRIKKHFWDSKKQKETKHSKLFHDELNKYEKDDFVVEVLEECDDENLLSRERYYIDLLDPPYNSVKRSRDDDFKKRISEGTKKWWSTLPNETREKIINNNLTGQPVGHPVSKETREKISASLTGRKQSEDTRKKRSEVLKEYYKTHEKKHTYGRSKKVSIDDNGEIKHYPSISLLAEAYGVCPSYVCKLLKNGEKLRGKDIWYEV